MTHRLGDGREGAQVARLDIDTADQVVLRSTRPDIDAEGGAIHDEAAAQERGLLHRLRMVRRLDRRTWAQTAPVRSLLLDPPNRLQSERAAALAAIARGRWYLGMGRGRFVAVRGPWCLPDCPGELLRRRDITDSVNPARVIGLLVSAAASAPLF